MQTQHYIAALIPDERFGIYSLAFLIFFLPVQMQHAIPRTSAATYKVIEAHWFKE